MGGEQHGPDGVERPSSKLRPSRFPPGWSSPRPQSCHCNEAGCGERSHDSREVSRLLECQQKSSQWTAKGEEDDVKSYRHQIQNLKLKQQSILCITASLMYSHMHLVLCAINMKVLSNYSCMQHYTCRSRMSSATMEAGLVRLKQTIILLAWCSMTGRLPDTHVNRARKLRVERMF